MACRQRRPGGRWSGMLIAWWWVIAGCGGAFDGAGGVDLAVTAFMAPSAAGVGEDIEVSYTMANRGGMPAIPATLMVFLSHGNQPPLENTHIGYENFYMFDPGESKSNAITATIWDNLAGGDYSIWAYALTAKGSDQHPENDYLGRQIAISGPGCLDDPYEEDDIPAEAGTIQVAETQLRNFCFDSVDWVHFPAIGGRSYGLHADSDVPMLTSLISVLAADATTEIANGIRRLEFVAPDSGDVFAAVRPHGNIMFSGPDSEYTLMLGDARPDLSMTRCGQPRATVPGGTLELSFEVANPGFGAAPASRAGFYLSTDASVTTDDLAIATRDVPPLDPEASTSDRFLVALSPDLSPSSYYLAAIADHDDALDESQEGNNVSPAVPLEVGASACTPDANEPDDFPAQAKPMTVDNPLLLNHCEDIHDWLWLEAVGGETYVISLSALGPGTLLVLELYDIDAATRLLPAPGQPSSSRHTWTAPADGVYYLWAGSTSAGNYGAGKDYTAKVENFLSDLTVRSGLILYDGGGPVPGGLVELHWEVYNSGYADAPAFTTALYISPDENVDTADRALAAFSVPGLAVRETTGYGSTILAFPPDLAPATYHLAMIVDESGSMAELNEGNNTGPIQVVSVRAPPCPPDAFEQDDFPADARAIALAEVQLRNHCDDQIDWVRFAALANTPYLIHIDPIGISVDTTIRVYTSDGGTLLHGPGDSFYDAQLFWRPTESAACAILVGWGPLSVGSSVDQNDYELFIEECPPDAYEADDEPAQAGPIAVGQTQARNFCDGTDDWLRLTTTAGTAHRLETFLVGANVDTNLDLYDAAGGHIASSFGAPGQADERIDWTAAADGDYLVKVSSTSYWGFDSEYTTSLE